jgi:uncharacterized protein (TIGR03000 family)
MYSVVLMAALSGGTNSPDWCLRWACHGCHGCRGGYCACGACWCGGGGGNGYCAHFGMAAPVCGHFCAFCGCYACYGNGGFYGGGYGNGLYGHGYGWGSGGWCGCFHATGCYCGHSSWGVPPVTVMPAAPAPPNGKGANGGKKEQEARLIVTVPEEAKLYIDGQLMKTGSGRRVFSTPTLRPGQTYFYDVKAEVVRDGQSVSREQRVYLRVGDVVTASFDGLNQPAVTARSQE